MISLQRFHREESDGALIRRFARQRDDEAFSILMGRYVDMVCTTCHRILGDEAQSADAVQETFFQLAKDAHRITGSVGSWLHRVATRRAVDVIRQNASRRRREENYASDAVSHSSTWSEVEPAVDEALEGLPETQREVLLLHFLQGRTTTQIAVAQGISQSTVSRRMNEALESLRQVLRERGVQAGLVPLQTVLLQSNRIAPEALRYALGKIALAKATMTSAAWTASASAPAGAGAFKIALATAAVALAAGTTWVAHRELSRSPAPIAAQTAGPQSAPAGADSGAPQTGVEDGPAQSPPASVPAQAAVQAGGAGALSPRAPRGLVFPGRKKKASGKGTPQAVLPVTVHTNIQGAHTQKIGNTNAEQPQLSLLATDAPPARAAATGPMWLYSAGGGTEVYVEPGANKRPAAAEVSAPEAKAFNGGIAARPFPAKSPAPVHTPAQPQKK
jgi:RNA polymerase sigma factor (sigma-70 family)